MHVLHKLSDFLVSEQSNTVSVTSLIGGTSDNTGSGVARRLGKLLLNY